MMDTLCEDLLALLRTHLEC